jgi:hypothetical protein
VHGFTCMTNHFHLLVRSRTGCLSESMRRVLNEYTKYFNRGRGRDGTLWKGRFSSKPVESRAYRRTLLRYIDRNPVAAGLAVEPWDYEHGSARRHARGRAPRWLCADWVVEEIGMCARNGARYADAFPAKSSPAQDRLVAARQVLAAKGCDELDDLLIATPPWVRRWFEGRARLADATKPGLPHVDAQTVMEVVDRVAAKIGDFPVRPGRNLRSGVRLLRVGLLRDLAGQCQALIARTCGLTLMVTRCALADHESSVVKDSAYLQRVVECAREALAACHGAGAIPPANSLTLCLTPE